MKRFTQNDLRKMYEAPPQALTEHIHETISFLPVHRQEEKNVNKKLRFSIIITAALVIVLMATALAGAVNESFNAMLYKTWPAFARMLMPVNPAYMDEDIQAEMNAVIEYNPATTRTIPLNRNN